MDLTDSIEMEISRPKKFKFFKEVDGHTFVFVWHGGHGINVYNADMSEEVDYFTVGDMERDEPTEPTLREVIRGVEQW